MDAADGARPDYLKPLLGGPPSVRGFKTGTAAGDSLVAGSLELRVPLTSPLSFGKIGVSAFVDAGTVYDAGQRLADQPWRRGVGGSVWFTAAFVRVNVAVAHGIGASTRVHVGGSLVLVFHHNGHQTQRKTGPDLSFACPLCPLWLVWKPGLRLLGRAHGMGYHALTPIRPWFSDPWKRSRHETCEARDPRRARLRLTGPGAAGRPRRAGSALLSPSIRSRAAAELRGLKKEPV